MSRRVRRFFYVWSRTGKVRHIQLGNGHSEGPVLCGKHSERGWLWFIPRNNTRVIPRCKNCERMAGAIDDGKGVIFVERVRKAA